MSDQNTMVVAYHKSGQRAEVPEHWLGDGSPFPGQWSKTEPKTDDAAKSASTSKEK